MIDAIQAGDIVVQGVPFDWNSSFLRGPALAPACIKEALLCESTNLWTESSINLEATSSLKFLDDMIFDDREKAFEEIEHMMNELLVKKTRIVALGGDHSITYPIIKSYSRHYTDLNILHFDAHPDLYDELRGNRYSHACPFARIMEENLVDRLVQVGIRTMTGHQRDQANRFAAEVIEMHSLHTFDTIKFEGPVYLSLDLDCLDPAFAPGVSHHEPGGMSTRDVLKVIQNLKGQLVGADIVELNPDRDPQGITAMVAGKLLKEIIGKML